MTDHETKLLKWVAEELLGWEFPGETDSVTRMKAERFAFEKLQSWGGIGLVVEAMDHREDVQEIIRFNRYLQECLDTVWWMLPMPYKCYFVFEAARKAVTND